MTAPMLRGGVGGKRLQQRFPCAHCVSTKFSQGSEVVPTCSQSLCPFHELPLWPLPPEGSAIVSSARCSLPAAQEDEGPTGIIQVVLRTLCFKQYRASWCVHKMIRLVFEVARECEVKTFLMEAAYCHMKRCSGETKSWRVSPAHCFERFEVSRGFICLEAILHGVFKDLQAASPPHKLQIQKLSLDCCG